MGYGLTWILGLPIWLSGCVLAERAAVIPRWRNPNGLIWLWRGAVWFISSLASVRHFHGGVGYVLTMPVFAIIGYFYLHQEISFAKSVSPSVLFEKLGQASYTIYLAHEMGLPIATMSGIPAAAIGGADRLLSWSGLMGIVTVLCTGFYFCVEAPFHRLARRIG